MTPVTPRYAHSALRPDLARIAGWIEPGSRVLDLGCGDGALLAHLRDHRQVRGAGVELDDTCVIACVRRGVEVIQQNLEDGLALFDDKQFDTVVLSQTLQSMH
ncbi:MAG: methionine biosynthesis protein MetW, partial [Achromobacter pestifer]